MRNAYNILVRKPERKRPLGRSRRRWEDDIRIDGWECVDWMNWLRIGISGEPF